MPGRIWRPCRKIDSGTIGRRPSQSCRRRPSCGAWRCGAGCVDRLDGMQWRADPESEKTAHFEPGKFLSTLFKRAFVDVVGRRIKHRVQARPIGL
jgi:hypothetical protein